MASAGFRPTFLKSGDLAFLEFSRKRRPQGSCQHPAAARYAYGASFVRSRTTRSKLCLLGGVIFPVLEVTDMARGFATIPMESIQFFV
jgi:hypothetical protein